MSGACHALQHKRIMKRHATSFKRELKRIPTYFIERYDLFVGILVVIAAGLTLEVLADGVEHAVERLIYGEPIKASHWWFIAFCLALTLFLSMLIWLLRHVFRSLHVR
jgi:H+/Cl- antiporter ClcA